jgi:hypothetical protein
MTDDKLSLGPSNARLFRGTYRSKPPTETNEQETPVFEEFGRFAFGGVAEELEDPAQGKE